MPEEEGISSRIKEIVINLIFLALVMIFVYIFRNELLALILILIGLVALRFILKLPDYLKPVIYKRTLSDNFKQAVLLIQRARIRAKNRIEVKALMSHRVGEDPARKTFLDALESLLEDPPPGIHVRFNHLLLTFEEDIIRKTAKMRIDKLREKKYSSRTQLNVAILVESGELIRKALNFICKYKYMGNIPSSLKNLVVKNVPNISLFIVKADGKYIGALLGLPQTGEPFGMGPALYMKGSSADTCRAIEQLYDEYWRYGIEIISANKIDYDAYDLIRTLIELR